MKKIAGIMVLLMMCSLLGCSSTSGEFDADKDILVISREDGSGTRGAFIDLFGLEKKDETTRKDLTTKEALIAKQGDVMLANVAANDYAIGYVSLGSINDSIKAVKIDGVVPTEENIQNETYKVARSFLIVVKENEMSDAAKEFIRYILSKQGQEVVSNLYVPINPNMSEYAVQGTAGKVVIAGSSSVAPLMEKLVEAYKLLNPQIEIEMQTNDSSAGIRAVLDGTCDISMASRELTATEASQLVSYPIARDGIVLIVNNNNPVDSLTMDQVYQIFSGEIEKWSGVIYG